MSERITDFVHAAPPTADWRCSSDCPHPREQHAYVMVSPPPHPRYEAYCYACEPERGTPWSCFHPFEPTPPGGMTREELIERLGAAEATELTDEACADLSRAIMLNFGLAASDQMQIAEVIRAARGKEKL